MNKQQVINSQQSSQNVLNSKRTRSDSLQCNESNFSLDEQKAIQIKKQTRLEEKEQPKQNPQGNQSDSHIQSDQNSEQPDKQRALSERNYEKEYDRASFKYINFGYSNLTNSLLKSISQEPNAKEISCKYPLFKILRSVVKIFLFNELEVLFFGYILEENNWAISDKLVRQQAFTIKDFLNISDIIDPLEYKSILLYLILNAYAVKSYLNDQNDMNMINYHITQLIPNISEIFKGWSQEYVQKSLQVKPKILNQMFRRLIQKFSENDSQDHVQDYNALVDAIISISPPYNSEKQQPEKDKEQNTAVQQPISTTFPVAQQQAQPQLATQQSSFKIQSQIGSIKQLPPSASILHQQPPTGQQSQLISQTLPQQGLLYSIAASGSIPFPQQPLFQSMHMSKNFSLGNQSLMYKFDDQGKKPMDYEQLNLLSKPESIRRNSSIQLDDFDNSKLLLSNKQSMQNFGNMSYNFDNPNMSLLNLDNINSFNQPQLIPPFLRDKEDEQLNQSQVLQQEEPETSKKKAQKKGKKQQANADESTNLQEAPAQTQFQGQAQKKK